MSCPELPACHYFQKLCWSTEHSLYDFVIKQCHKSCKLCWCQLVSNVFFHCQIMRFISKTEDQIIIDYIYLGSEKGKTGGVEDDISRRLSLALIFVKLKPVWISTTFRSKTKLKIFRSNVLAVLLYGDEAWSIAHPYRERCLTFGQVWDECSE